jgi:hypothetical protein
VTAVTSLRARGPGRPALVLPLVVVLVVAGFASASCGLDLSDLSNGGDALPDAAAAAADGPSNEAGLQSETGAGSDAEPNDSAAGPRKNSCGGLLFGTPLPLFNPDFELGCTNGWSVYAGGATEDTALPSSGAIACRVCTASNGPDGFFISATLGRPVLAGEIYELVACVRAVPAASSAVSPYAEMNAGTEGHRDSTVALGPTYTSVRASFSPTAAHADLGMNIRVSPGVAGDCFLVDDVSVARVRDATTN